MALCGNKNVKERRMPQSKQLIEYYTPPSLATLTWMGACCLANTITGKDSSYFQLQQGVLRYITQLQNPNFTRINLLGGDLNRACKNNLTDTIDTLIASLYRLCETDIRHLNAVLLRVGRTGLINLINHASTKAGHTESDREAIVVYQPSLSSQQELRFNQVLLAVAMEQLKTIHTIDYAPLSMINRQLRSIKVPPLDSRSILCQMMLFGHEAPACELIMTLCNCALNSLTKANLLIADLNREEAPLKQTANKDILYNQNIHRTIQDTLVLLFRNIESVTEDKLPDEYPHLIELATQKLEPFKDDPNVSLYYQHLSSLTQSTQNIRLYSLQRELTQVGLPTIDARVPLCRLLLTGKHPEISHAISTLITCYKTGGNPVKKSVTATLQNVLTYDQSFTGTKLIDMDDLRGLEVSYSIVKRMLLSCLHEHSDKATIRPLYQQLAGLLGSPEVNAKAPTSTSKKMWQSTKQLAGSVSNLASSVSNLANSVASLTKEQHALEPPEYSDDDEDDFSKDWSMVDANRRY